MQAFIGEGFYLNDPFWGEKLVGRPESREADGFRKFPSGFLRKQPTSVNSRLAFAEAAGFREFPTGSLRSSRLP